MRCPFAAVAALLLAGCAPETVDPSPLAGDLDAGAATSAAALPPPTPRDGGTAPHP